MSERVLGREIVQRTRLSADVWQALLSDGVTCIVKRVPRQERPTWQPGRPWAELVALDILAAEGAPVPKLLAADLERGHLVQAHVAGVTLRERQVQAFDDALATKLFADLDRAVHVTETVLERAAQELAPFVVEISADERTRMFADVGRALTQDAVAAWESMLAAGFGESAPPPSLGSLDIQPENAIAGDGRVTLIDFATLGRIDREQRLVGYVHRAHPQPGTLLSPQGFTEYGLRWGEIGALRLAAYDFAFTLPIIAAAAKSSQRGSTLAAALDLWERERFDEARVNAVRKGLRRGILQEMGAQR